MYFGQTKYQTMNLYAQTKSNSIKTESKNKRLRWLGLVLRIKPNRIPKMVRKSETRTVKYDLVAEH